jgi:hypothetical protein
MLCLLLVGRRKKRKKQGREVVRGFFPQGQRLDTPSDCARWIFEAVRCN